MKLNNKPNRHQQPWTKEEIEYLEERWGNISIGQMAKTLGRTEIGIREKAGKLGLGRFLENGWKYVTKHQFMMALGYGNSGGYKNISWIKNRGLPTHRITRHKQTFQVIYIDEFWEWAEKNQAFLDFSKFELYALGPEPEWVAAKRKRDYKKSQQYKMTPWTQQEDDRLKKYLSDNRYTVMELSKMINRTCGAIQRRIQDLQLETRPVKANNQIKWTDEEWGQLAEMIKQGWNYEDMSDVLGRSTKAIRGRVFDMYLTERLDKVRAYIGDGKWGDGQPERPLRYMRVMAPEQKEVAKDQLSLFAFLLLEAAKNKSGVREEYRDYFQKDMCMNWDDIRGCLAGESSCDYCSQFQRIQPQYCCVCGATFYERKEQKVCASCRIRRKKQAQKKYAILQGRKNRQPCKRNGG